MENNDVLRKFRYALNIPDATMLNIFKKAECRIDKAQLLNLMKKKEDTDYTVCSTELLELFFDGLILYNRGDQEEGGYDQQGSLALHDKKTSLYAQGKATAKSESLSNNTILKKIRIALDLKQEDMMEIFRLGKVKIAKGEFTALFRKEGHKNYKECGDQYLRKFLDGLAVRHRL